MRITSAESYQSLLQGIQSIKERMQQAQIEITSGNKINQPSDDPAGAADVVRLTGDKSEMAQYASNAAAAKGRLDYTDTVLNSVQTMVQRVITLGQVALSNPATASQSSTTEINGLRNQMISSANTAFEGVFIFGGSVTNQPPYVLQTDQSVAYHGNSAALQVQVGRSSLLQTQIPGSQVFSGSINVFDNVKQLSDAINSGDKTAMQAQLDKLQQYYDSVSVARSQVGSLSNLAQSTQSDLQSYELARSTDQSRIQTADMAKAATDFTQAQTALQAAISAGAKISQISILDYLP